MWKKTNISRQNKQITCQACKTKVGLIFALPCHEQTNTSNPHYVMLTNKQVKQTDYPDSKMLVSYNKQSQHPYSKQHAMIISKSGPVLKK